MPKRRFQFLCPRCRAEVKIAHDDIYGCECNWLGRYPERLRSWS